MKYSIKGTGSANIRPIANGFLVSVSIRREEIQDLNDLLKPEASMEGNPVYTMLQNVNKTLGDAMPDETIKALTQAISGLAQPTPNIGLIFGPGGFNNIPGSNGEYCIFFKDPAILGKFFEDMAAGKVLNDYFPNEAGLVEPAVVTMEVKGEKA
jgi:hypothetical protein